MENRLLADGDLQRILECETLEAAVKILGETAYAAWLPGMASHYEFDKIIEEELLFNYRETEKFVPDALLVRICRLPYDVHNVKVILKSGFLAKEGGERQYRLLTRLGNIATDTLILAIEGEDYILLPRELLLALRHAASIWEQTRSLRDVERFLDNWMFLSLRKAAQELNFSDVSLWVRSRIDAENLKTLVRVKRLGFDAQEAQLLLHDGGGISMERLLSLLAEPTEAWGRVLAASSLGGVYASTQEGADIASLVTELEKLLDEFSYHVIKNSKYEAFAPGNVLLYLWQKELEAKNLRIALVAVANGTDREIARRLLRHVH
jgi:V/A-type H+-transporting ATPase subunit C